MTQAVLSTLPPASDMKHPPQRLEVSDSDLMLYVSRVASRIVKTYGKMEHDEAIGWAQLGVTKALNGFDVSMLDRCRNDQERNVRISKRLCIKGFFEAVDEMRIRRAVERKNNGKLTTRIISASQYLYVEDVNGKTVWLGEPADHREQKSADAVISHEVIGKFYRYLTGVYKAVFFYCHLRSLTMKETGHIMRVSESRVSQIHSQMILILKSKTQSKS